MTNINESKRNNTKEQNPIHQHKQAYSTSYRTLFTAKWLVPFGLVKLYTFNPNYSNITFFTTAWYITHKNCVKFFETSNYSYHFGINTSGRNGMIQCTNQAAAWHAPSIERGKATIILDKSHHELMPWYISRIEVCNKCW